MKTTKYVCKACRNEFGVPDTVYERYGTGRPERYKEIPVCPFCGSEGYEEKRSAPSKDELKQYIHLSKEISMAESRLAKMDRTDVRYIGLYEMIENNKLRCVTLLIKLQSYIYSIDDSLMRQIFELRYVKGLTWAAVAAQLGSYYDEDHVRIMHDRYLAKKS